MKLAEKGGGGAGVRGAGGEVVGGGFENTFYACMEFSSNSIFKKKLSCREEWQWPYVSNLFYENGIIYGQPYALSLPPGPFFFYSCSLFPWEMKH